MREKINIIEALLLFALAIHGFLYYTGKLNYRGEKEKKRRERVGRYGWGLIIVIIFMLISGLSLLILTLNS